MFILIRRNFKKKYTNIAFGFGINKLDQLKVKQTDDIVKFIFSEAEYIICNKNDSQLFEITNQRIKDIDHYHLYSYFYINGKLYKTFYSSNYENLVNAYNMLQRKKRKKAEQLSLF